MHHSSRAHTPRAADFIGHGGPHRMTISKAFLILAGGLTALAFMVSALWGWQNASILVQDAVRPEVAVWAIRSGAIALAAAAQGVVIAMVVQRVYRNDDQFGTALR